MSVGIRRERYEVAREDRAWIARYGWRSVRDILACASGDVAAVSRSSNVVRVELDGAPDDGPPVVYLKRYLYEQRGQRIKQMFRGTLFGKSRARIEYDCLREMCRRNVPTVRPIAYGEERVNGFLVRSFVLTEGTEGSNSLDLFAIDAIRRGSLDRAQRRRLIAELGLTIRNMHDAGVRHGGLYWRNILVRSNPDGGFVFTLLDPDTRARLSSTTVSTDDAVADLSELVASGMGLGIRLGLSGFMRAYFRATRLDSHHRAMIACVVQAAKKLAPAEQQRMAATEAIEWFRKRVEAARERPEAVRVFKSLDEFFDALSLGSGEDDSAVVGGGTIQFVFADDAGGNGSNHYEVVMDGDRVCVRSNRVSNPDLLIRSDAQTWLSVISGQATAFEQLSAGRLRLEGDTRLLTALAAHIDGRSLMEESSAGQPSASFSPGAEGQSAGASVQPPKRSFGRKYKTDDFAKYYADKHDSTLMRRASNYLERRMIARALNRVRRRGSFKSVLDCPSGTGRFLPILAEFDASVIAIDTSETMLREGFRYHDLFRETPSASVASGPWAATSWPAGRSVSFTPFRI